MTGYREVVSWFEDMRNQGYLRPGDMLPSERLLSRVWDVPRSTISRAMLELRCQGWIESHPGKGHFVCDPPPIDIEPKAEFL